MAHLEKNRIVHRDLAARNILVGETHETIKVDTSAFYFARINNDFSLPILEWLVAWTMKRCTIWTIKTFSRINGRRQKRSS